MLFPASFKLALMCCSCLHRLLPWVASCSLVMHHACCASCLGHVWCVYLCCVLLLVSSYFVAIMGIRSSTIGSASSVHLLHGLVLLPCGISGKMTIPSKSLLSLLAYLLALLLCLCYDAYHLPIMPPKLPCRTSNPPCPSKLLIGYVTALLSPSYSVASCRWRLEIVPCWNIIYLLGYHYIAMLS